MTAKFYVSEQNSFFILSTEFLYQRRDSRYERLTDTNPWISNISVWILVVERFTRLTVASHSVVQTVITNSSTNITRCHIHCHVKVAVVRVAVTVTLCRSRQKQNENS